MPVPSRQHRETASISSSSQSLPTIPARSPDNPADFLATPGGARVLPWLKRKKQTKSRSSWKGLIPPRAKGKPAGQLGFAVSFSCWAARGAAQPPPRSSGVRADHLSVCPSVLLVAWGSVPRGIRSPETRQVRFLAASGSRARQRRPLSEQPCILWRSASEAPSFLRRLLPQPARERARERGRVTEGLLSLKLGRRRRGIIKEETLGERRSM